MFRACNAPNTQRGNENGNAGRDHGCTGGAGSALRKASPRIRCNSSPVSTGRFFIGHSKCRHSSQSPTTIRSPHVSHQTVCSVMTPSPGCSRESYVRTREKMREKWLVLADKLYSPSSVVHKNVLVSATVRCLAAKNTQAGVGNGNCGSLPAASYGCLDKSALTNKIICSQGALGHADDPLDKAQRGHL